MKAFRSINGTIASLCTLCAALSFFACASNSPKPTTSLDNIIAKESMEQKEASQLNEKLFALARSAPRPGEYILGEGDLIQVNVFEDKEMNREARLGAQGLITLPLIGSLELEGLTASEAEQEIQNACRNGYLIDPHVNISIKEQNRSKVTLLGALKNPGTYDYFSQQRILDVLALAGGLSEKAGQMVQVRRDATDPGHPSTLVIDLNQLIKEGKSELNIDIQRGDVVFIPESGQVYVDGAVRRPGNYPIRQAMTVQEAVLAAGGFSTTADEGDIKLVRFSENGQREVTQLSAKETGVGAASNLEVKDRDIVFVETSTLEALIYGLHLNSVFGLVGFGYSPPAQ